MDIWLDMIRENNLYKAAHPVDKAEIDAAENRLGILFAEDYRRFLSSVGACICFSHEIKGISDSVNLNVISATEEARSRYELLPHSWYVIEDTQMDGILILQDRSGTIYRMAPGKNPEKIAYNLESYLAEVKAGLKTRNGSTKGVSISLASEGKLEDEAKGILSKGYEEARQKLDHPDQVEKVLQQLEKKLEKIPGVGDWLADMPAVISLIRSYIRKEYRDIPVSSIIAALAAAIYVVSPVDLIPDVIPGIGVLDDAAVFVVCWKMIHDDVDKYQEWRRQNGKAE